jgi:hypothetical protein
MRRLALLVVLLVPTAASADAQQFDLLCSGKETIRGAEVDWSQRFAVDLTQGVFCQVPCTGKVRRLIAIEPYRLVLEDNDGRWPEIGDPPERQHFSIDRVTGAVDRVEDGALGLQISTGVCAPAPFTPLPKPSF